MMELPELGSQDLVDLTPGNENFDVFGNVDPVGHLQNVFTLSDETLDIASVEDLQEFKPVAARGPPLPNSTPGRANFCVEVASNNINKKKFLYSHKLGRIYVEKDCNFSVYFNWDGKQTPPDMYVRATVVFSDVEQSEKRVERCLQHFYEAQGLPQNIAKNVLQSSREIGTQGVFYCGDVNALDSWLSVLVHYHKTAPEPCSHAYKFTCKSSCASGINRRAIAIIFTLEDQSGEVYGRQKVGVKVCACPKRDLRRDERDLRKDEETEEVKGGKRPITSNTNTKSKKIKLESPDVQFNMAVLPQVAVEVDAMISGLRTMIDNMRNASKHSPAHHDAYAISIAELQKEILKYEETPHK